MPLVQVKVIEGVFTAVEKRAMVRKLTDAMVAVEGENLRPLTWVVIEEVKSGDWGIGGKSLIAADVKTLASGIPLMERAWADSDPSTICAGSDILP